MILTKLVKLRNKDIHISREIYNIYRDIFKPYTVKPIRVISDHVTERLYCTCSFSNKQPSKRIEMSWVKWLI